MKALWIRVEAHELRSLRMTNFADALEVSQATALGHFVALGGAIAEHLEDGNLTDVKDKTLADWGGWTGKPAKFAEAVRGVLVGTDGVYADWADTMGKLVQRRAIDRQRKAPKAQNSMENPRKLRGNSVETDPGFRGNSVATERNGTVRKEPESTRGIERTEKRSAFNTPAGDLADTAAPLRSLALEQLTAELTPAIRQFVAHFYGRAHPDRQRDVVQQLVSLQRLEPVNDGGRQPIRAYSVDRLEAKCREVVLAKIRDQNAAIVVLFCKLGDTSDLAGSGALPGQVEAKALAPSGPLDERVTDLIAGVATARTLPPKPLSKPDR